MSDSKNFSEKAFERIKKGERSPESRKKRRLSRILLLADGVLIVLILLFFYGDKKGPIYETASVKFRDLDIRYSVSTEEESGDYLFAMTVKNSTNKPIKYFFKKSLAVLSVRHESKQIFSTIIAEGVKEINLSPGKNKTFVEMVPKKNLEITGNRKPARKSLFDFTDTRIPLEAVFVFSPGEEITTSITFKHGVK